MFNYIKNPCEMFSYNDKENRYEIKVTDALPVDFIPLVQDLIKFSTVILLYNFMMFSADKKSTNMASTFIQLLYITIGLVVYWVIFNKMFTIV